MTPVNFGMRKKLLADLIGFHPILRIYRIPTGPQPDVELDLAKPSLILRFGGAEKEAFSLDSDAGVNRQSGICSPESIPTVPAFDHIQNLDHTPARQIDVFALDIEVSRRDGIVGDGRLRLLGKIRVDGARLLDLAKASM